jgi:hypothetical protein
MQGVIEVLLLAVLPGQECLGYELGIQVAEIPVEVLGTCFAILVVVLGISPGIL